MSVSAAHPRAVPGHVAVAAHHSRFAGVVCEHQRAISVQRYAVEHFGSNQGLSTLLVGSIEPECASAFSSYSLWRPSTAFASVTSSA